MPNSALTPIIFEGRNGEDGIFSEIASQAEAEAGTNNTKGMTPLRAKQALEAQKGAPDGVATLDGDGLIPLEQLPTTALVAAAITGPSMSLPSGAYTPVVWGNTEFEQGTVVSGDDSGFTAPSDGVYSVEAVIEFDVASSSSGQDRTVHLKRNGDFVMEVWNPAVEDLGGTRSISRKLLCAAGDEITFEAYQNSGAAIDIYPRYAGIDYKGYAPPPVAPESPLDIANLLGFWQADPTAANNSAIMLISDQSGNDHDAAQVTSGNRMTNFTNVVNGLPVMRCVPGKSLDISANFSDFTAGMSAFAVVNVSSSANYATFLRFGGGGGNYIDWLQVESYSNNYISINNTASGGGNDTNGPDYGGLTLNTFVLIEIHIGAGTANSVVNATPALNGTESTASPVIVPATATRSNNKIGDCLGSTTPYLDIAAVWAFNRILNTEEREICRNWANDTYNLY